MPREKELYRVNLERLDAMFPGKELLNKKEIMEFTGLKRDAAIKYFGDLFEPGKQFISKAKLARALS